MFRVPVLVKLVGNRHRLDTIEFQNDPTPQDVGMAVWEGYGDYLAYVAQYPNGEVMGQADVRFIEENPSWRVELETELLSQLG